MCSSSTTVVGLRTVSVIVEWDSGAAIDPILSPPEGLRWMHLLCLCVWAILYIRWRLGLFTARLLAAVSGFIKSGRTGSERYWLFLGLERKREEVCNPHLFFHFQDVSRWCTHCPVYKSLCIIMGTGDGYTRVLYALDKLVWWGNRFTLILRKMHCPRFFFYRWKISGLLR